MDFITELQTKLLSNNLFSSGFVLMVLGALMAYARNLPSKFYEFIKNRLIFNITIEDRDPSYNWVIYWLEKKYSNNKKKKLIVFTKYNLIGETKLSYSNENENSIRIYFKLNSSGVLIRYKKSFIYIKVNREKMESKNNFIINFFESITFYFISFNGRKIIKEIIKEAHKFFTENEDKNLINIYSQRWDNWALVSNIPKRNLDSIYFDNDIDIKLFDDISNFIKSKDWILKMGIPYKRGYLLYGKPGNGKTSLIHAVASLFSYNICYIALSSINDDNDLINLLMNIPNKSILVFEDIDAIFDENRKNKNKNSKLTFSGFLNVLDGFSSTSEKLTFFTTNYREKLDKALLRPGRIDYEVFIDDGNINQIIKMFKYFFNNYNNKDINYLINIIGNNKIQMAKVQELFFRNKNDKKLAIIELKNHIMENKKL